MKYIFEMSYTSGRKNNRDPGARFDHSILRTPGSDIAYATAHGRTEQIATYRANLLAAALTATQNMTLNVPANGFPEWLFNVTMPMPQMTGLQLIKEIKIGWPNLPVTLATGFAELPPSIDPLQITLAKPFLQYDLAQAVRAAIEDPKTRRVERFRTSQS